jgi:hypothetical protein
MLSGLDKVPLKDESAGEQGKRPVVIQPQVMARALPSTASYGLETGRGGVFHTRKVRLLDVWAGRRANPAPDVLELGLKPCHRGRSFLRVARPQVAK